MTIRPYTREDIPAMLSLIRELAAFEKAPEKVRNTVEQMERESQWFECVVAEDTAGKIIGMALYYFAYYTWVGKSLYLDDLIVRENCRGQGIGTALFERVVEEARINDCKRMRWQVLDWNEAAIRLYEKYDCDIDRGWLTCDLNFI